MELLVFTYLNIILYSINTVKVDFLKLIEQLIELLTNYRYFMY